MSTITQTTLTVSPLTVRIGAEVSGIPLGDDLDDHVVAEIRRALLRYKVLFFRGQHHLDDAMHSAFTSRLGKPIPHPTVTAEGLEDDASAVFEVDSQGIRATSWHSDMTFVTDYPAFSVLRGIVIPPVGGDTAWANTVTAYHDLPEPLRMLSERLWAVHTNTFDYAAAARTRESTHAELEFRRSFESVAFATEHPVVRVHPETGERALVVGGFSQKLVGLSLEDSRQLQSLLLRYVTRQENTVRWTWTAGDVAVWDNRSTMHVAVDDYGDAPRHLHRISVEGEAPVSVDGRHSVARTGAEAAWYRRDR